MAQSLINIRMDESLKRKFDYICEELGMNMTTAITVFAKKVCREKRIPFELSISSEYAKEEDGMNERTKYRVEFWLENYDKGTVKSDVYDTLNEALLFISAEEEKYDNDILWDHIPCFYIEFVNDDCEGRNGIRLDEEGFWYISNDISKHIDRDEVDDLNGFIFGFVAALKMS